MPSRFPEILAIPEAVLAGWNDDTSRLFVIGNLTRPGAVEWLHELEVRHFYPGTPRNDLFELSIFHWEGLPYFVLGVPLGERAVVEEICRNLKFRLANGIPTMLRSILRSHVYAIGSIRLGRDIAPRGWMSERVFPLHSPRTFSLEPDHQVRSGIPHGTGVVAGAALVDTNPREREAKEKQFNQWLVEAAARNRARWCN